jgi:hypothetical protein
MAKPKMVICKYCKNKIDKKDAFIEEYLNDNLEIKNRYFCNEECYNDKQKEEKRKIWLKEVKKLSREKARELCGLSEKEKSIYFSSTYKIITDKFEDELIYEFLCKYEKDIKEILDSKDFKTSASRIKYFSCMIENQLERYLLEKEQPKQIEESSKEIEVDDFDIVVNVEKKEKRRNINDILGL